MSSTLSAPGFSMEQKLCVQVAYLTVKMSIYTVLAYPWLRSLIRLVPDEQYREVVANSIAAPVDAARNAILLTERIRFEAQTPAP
ncbi:hypothetical protein LTR78_001773 [Recurvomyces mirabilis]|uniref:Uncharacterized protein n=1 Tax=Recurvomyces mirabilis TaxID=574656 RepID=A0AAE0WUJ7_9PEZI|nr:hypothetical protein LTR78_001773 [Recurvomyces mirabilis]